MADAEIGQKLARTLGDLAVHRDNLTGLQAFELLVKVSKETNIKLVDVARWLVSEQEGGVTPA